MKFRYIEAGSRFKSLFPLTPALSLRERVWQGATLKNSGGLRFANRLATILPLPKGEGRGEGKGIVRFTHVSKLFCCRAREKFAAFMVFPDLSALPHEMDSVFFAGTMQLNCGSAVVSTAAVGVPPMSRPKMAAAAVSVRDLTEMRVTNKSRAFD